MKLHRQKIQFLPELHGVHIDFAGAPRWNLAKGCSKVAIGQSLAKWIYPDGERPGAAAGPMMNCREVSMARGKISCTFTNKPRNEIEPKGGREVKYWV